MLLVLTRTVQSGIAWACARRDALPFNAPRYPRGAQRSSESQSACHPAGFARRVHKRCMSGCRVPRERSATGPTSTGRRPISSGSGSRSASVTSPPAADQVHHVRRQVRRFNRVGHENTADAGGQHGRTRAALTQELVVLRLLDARNDPNVGREVPCGQRDQHIGVVAIRADKQRAARWAASPRATFPHGSRRRGCRRIRARPPARAALIDDRRSACGSCRSREPRARPRRTGPSGRSRPRSRDPAIEPEVCAYGSPRSDAAEPADTPCQ